MDPQKLSQLDPKLRDAYQRVMGTVIPEPQAAPIQTQTPPPPTLNPTPDPIPQPTPEPIPQPEPQPAPAIPQPISEPQPAINPQPETPPVDVPIPQTIPTQPASNFVQMNSEVPAAPAAPAPAPIQNFATPAPQTQTVVIKKKNGMMMPVLFGIVGLVFIVIYTLFWTKIFNFKLPFLP